MKILTFSTLFPNAVATNHGLFVERRLQQLLASAGGSVQARVMAPVPWFPFSGRVFGEYAGYSQVPPHETRDGLAITHPRFPVIPKLGMSIAPLLLYQAVRPRVRELLESGYDFDLIDAHYYYPDGVAAVLLDGISTGRSPSPRAAPISTCCRITGCPAGRSCGPRVTPGIRSPCRARYAIGWSRWARIRAG